MKKQARVPKPYEAGEPAAYEVALAAESHLGRALACVVCGAEVDTMNATKRATLIAPEGRELEI